MSLTGKHVQDIEDVQRFKVLKFSDSFKLQSQAKLRCERYLSEPQKRSSQALESLESKQRRTKGSVVGEDVTASPAEIEPMTILRGRIHTARIPRFATPYVCVEACRTQVADATFCDDTK